MFTGIVQALGKVTSVHERRVAIAAPFDLSRVAIGASIAVDGVCLTVVSRRGRRFEADIGPETFARTTLGSLKAGDRVHLERPLRLGDELGGHLVSGHVDGVGRIARRQKLGTALALTIEVPKEVTPALAPKGSITVDGVSLTVNQVRKNRFQVVLIPHTLAVTRLGERRVGDRVNIEGDLIAKHVARLVKHAV